MATSHETIYSHTCDLCGATCEKEKLRRFGLAVIAESTFMDPDKRINGPMCDVCPDCTSRPIADILGHLQPPEREADRDRRTLRETVNGRR